MRLDPLDLLVDFACPRGTVPELRQVSWATQGSLQLVEIRSFPLLKSWD
jgi:hypothetical protein